MIRTFALLACLTACASTNAPQTSAPAPPDAAVPTDAPAREAPPRAVGGATAGARMYRGRSEDEWIRRMSEQPVVRVVERFQSTLYVWHLDLGDGVEISFQPEQVNLETFWRREIASWHLARLLGITFRALRYRLAKLQLEGADAGDEDE